MDTNEPPLIGIVIPTDMRKPWERVSILRPRLLTLQGIVGGHIEAVNLVNPAATIYCHEMGKIIGLKPNKRATFLAWLHTGLYPNDYIAGDAVLVGPVDDWGEDTDVDELYERHLEALPGGSRSRD